MCQAGRALRKLRSLTARSEEGRLVYVAVHEVLRTILRRFIFEGGVATSELPPGASLRFVTLLDAALPPSPSVAESPLLPKSVLTVAESNARSSRRISALILRWASLGKSSKRFCV